MKDQSQIPDNHAGNETDLPAHKQSLRQQMAERREHHDIHQLTLWTEAIWRHLLVSDFLAPITEGRLTDHQLVNQLSATDGKPGIGLFIAMRQEVDFQPVWQSLRTRGFRLCFPRMILSEGRTDLEFLAIPDQDDPAIHLVQSRFGVREPAAATVQNGLSSCDPAVILLPGLAYDHTGNRLGWGQGYYDHYLARRLRQKQASRPILIGVAYPFQILDQVPAGDNDIPVDYLLSPTGLEKAHQRKS